MEQSHQSEAAHQRLHSCPRISISTLPPPIKFLRHPKSSKPSANDLSLNKDAVAAHRASVGRMAAELEPANWSMCSSSSWGQEAWDQLYIALNELSENVSCSVCQAQALGVCSVGCANSISGNCSTLSNLINEHRKFAKGWYSPSY